MTKRRRRSGATGPRRNADLNTIDEPVLAWQCIDITADGSHDTGVCSCCGHVSRLVWGHAALNDDGIARYFVHWTLGDIANHGANFDVILGPWDDGTPDDQRRSVSLAYWLFESGPSFMVIDAEGRPFTASPLAGVPLARPDVVGTSLAPIVFAIVDAICMKDSRIGDLVPR